MAPPLRKIRVLELYSGIGGMHCALEGSSIPYEVVMAADVNTSANLVYSHNFPDTYVNASAIESISVEDFEDLNIEMILMSPPCQPFTRVGNQKDTKDIRTKSFLHVLNVLKKLKNKPEYILVENVKGFESSESRQRLVDTLQHCEYKYQEFLLTPLQFGIPNSRLRYFLVAKKTKSFVFDTADQIMSSVPDCATKWLSWKQDIGNQNNTSLNDQCACFGNDEETSNTKDSENQSTKGVKRAIESTEHDSVGQETDGKESIDSGTVHKRQKVDSAKDIENSEENAKEKCEKRMKVKCDSQEAKADSKTESDNIDKKCSDDTKPVKNQDMKDSQNKEESLIKTKDCLQNYGENLRLPLTDEQKAFGVCRKLHHFLEDKYNCVDLFKGYLVPQKDFKQLMVMDIVNGCTQKTCCFTKRYGHYINGAGSLVVMSTDTQAIEKASKLKQTASELKNKDKWAEEEFSIIRNLKLRYFTPREIANILCFPQRYDFPEELTKRQLYMLLGNSLNVHIVTVLIKLMTAGDLES